MGSATRTIRVQFEPLEVELPSTVADEDLKDYVLKHYGGSLKVTSQTDDSLETVKHRLDMLDKIAEVQRQYLQMEEPRVVFGQLLTSLLDLMSSEYGFIGEVKYEDDGTMYLQTHAITNIAWNAATHKFYDENIEAGLKFYNMQTLFGRVLVTKEPVISNEPKNDPRAGGIPSGHPPLIHFLGIPFFEGTKLIGMVGIANKPGGYTEQDVRFLEPFTITCSNLIQAYAAMQENRYLIDTLEDKVRKRTAALVKTNDQLEQANKEIVRHSEAQLQHFACMSHEIRTPLNCVIALSSLLEDTPLTPVQRDSLQMIITSGELLLAVVNDVLDYSKLESGNVEVHVTETRLQTTLDAVVHSISQPATDKQVSLTAHYGAEVPSIIATDSRRLQQILYNLLGNAIKFSDEGGTVELHCDVVEPPPSKCPFHKMIGRQLRFVVKDYGMGIDKKDLESIFKPFRQATTEHGGTGLGLSITSKLVAALGGKISVDSMLGEWSEFRVEFPLNNDTDCVESIKSRLSSVSRLVVVHEDESLGPLFSKIEKVLEKPVVAVDSCEALAALSAGDDHVSLCIVNEKLFNSEQYQCFANSQKSLLLSFGSQYAVKTSQKHLRSLHDLLPVTLLEALAEAATHADRAIDPSVEESKTAVPPYNQVRVLIAEDNVVNQKVLLRILNRIGIEKVDIVGNGVETVQAVLKNEYHVVFMDMQMPVMDGLEACRQIVAQQPDHPRPRIVFVTAHAMDSFERNAEDAGADSFISKPFNLKQIEDYFQSVALE